MNNIQLLDSFVEILQLVSLENRLIDPDKPLSEIISENGVDELDYELAVLCFEATHRVIIDYNVGDEINMDQSVTLSEIISNHVIENHPDLLDRHFVTTRFIWFRDAIISALKRRMSEAK